MAYREKAAWASLLTTILVWGGYFAYLAAQVASGRPDGNAILERFVGAVVLSIVLSIIAAVILAFTSRNPDAPADERERLVELSSTSAAYTVLTVAVVIVALSAPFLALGTLGLFPGDPAADTALVLSNGVLLALVLAELLRSGLSIARYRLGRSPR